MLQTFCTKSLPCDGQAVTTANVTACVARNIQNPMGYHCDVAISVGASYDQCIQQVQNRQCSNADGGASSDAGAAADGGMTMSEFPACDTAFTFL